MSQSKIMSFIESWANIFVGYTINVVVQIIIYPWFGIHTSIQSNMMIGGIFTLISLTRSYCLRRLFNRREN